MPRPWNSITSVKIIKNSYVQKREQFMWIDILQLLTYFYIFYLFHIC
jgi:hypothetical protein